MKYLEKCAAFQQLLNSHYVIENDSIKSGISLHTKSSFYTFEWFPSDTSFDTFGHSVQTVSSTLNLVSAFPTPKSISSPRHIVQQPQLYAEDGFCHSAHNSWIHLSWSKQMQKPSTCLRPLGYAVKCDEAAIHKNTTAINTYTHKTSCKTILPGSLSSQVTGNEHNIKLRSPTEIWGSII